MFISRVAKTGLAAQQPVRIRIPIVLIVMAPPSPTTVITITACHRSSLTANHDNRLPKLRRQPLSKIALNVPKL